MHLLITKDDKRVGEKGTEQQLGTAQKACCTRQMLFANHLSP